MQYGSNVPRQFFIGFDHFFNLIEAQPWKSETNTYDSYPPHNVIKHDEDNYAIEMAVAGFKAADIDIEVQEDVLNVTGNRKDDRTYSHKGIATRNFFKTFTLADYVIVTGSNINDGILTINLKRVVPEHKKPRKIPIGTTAASPPQFLKE